VTEAERAALLAAADDELLLGHRNSEWTGLAPHVEADVALSSLAQDEMAHAAALYGLLSPADPDALACGRSPQAYRHARLVEAGGRDFAFSVVRQYLYDIYEDLRIQRFQQSELPELRAVAERMAREERYHRLHDRALARALGPRLQPALDRAWPLALGLFEATGAFDVDEGQWRAVVLPELAEWELVVPNTPAILGGRRGLHGPDFQQLWEDLTGLFRADPSRHW
jgi:ring-1,2-phenylacetyl-CoA epoxidase subunit PaaC